MRVGLLFVVLAATAGCDDGKPKTHNVLKEAIDIKGTCSEDHVGQRDSYSGQVVRWQTQETGKISAYGFVWNGTKNILDEVQHPTKYHPPWQIEFSQIDIDTDQQHWVCTACRAAVRIRRDTTQRATSTWSGGGTRSPT
jgi:hypothetical protein